MPPMSNKAKMIPTQVQILRFLDHFLRCLVGLAVFSGSFLDFLVVLGDSWLSFTLTSSPVSSSKSKVFKGSRKSSLISSVDLTAVWGSVISGKSGREVWGTREVLRGGTNSSGWRGEREEVEREREVEELA